MHANIHQKLPKYALETTKYALKNTKTSATNLKTVKNYLKCIYKRSNFFSQNVHAKQSFPDPKIKN